MQVIQFYESDRQEYWLEQIKKSDWGAGQYLYSLVKEGKLKETVGPRVDLLLLVDGDQLISFATYADLDDVQPTELTPWIGFVYTFPEYRGHHYVGKLFDEAVRIAKKEGVEKIYISTNHIGLYEKYDCEFFQMMKDIEGEDSRIYIKHVK